MTRKGCVMRGLSARQVRERKRGFPPKLEKRELHKSHDTKCHRKVIINETKGFCLLDLGMCRSQEIFQSRAFWGWREVKEGCM